MRWGGAFIFDQSNEYLSSARNYHAPNDGGGQISSQTYIFVLPSLFGAARRENMHAAKYVYSIIFYV
jgi:hypothetical protein